MAGSDARESRKITFGTPTKPSSQVVPPTSITRVRKAVFSSEETAPISTPSLSPAPATSQAAKSTSRTPRARASDQRSPAGHVLGRTVNGKAASSGSQMSSSSRVSTPRIQPGGPQVSAAGCAEEEAEEDDIQYQLKDRSSPSMSPDPIEQLSNRDHPVEAERPVDMSPLTLSQRKDISTPSASPSPPLTSKTRPSGPIAGDPPSPVFASLDDDPVDSKSIHAFSPGLQKLLESSPSLGDDSDEDMPDIDVVLSQMVRSSSKKRVECDDEEDQLDDEAPHSTPSPQRRILPTARKISAASPAGTVKSTGKSPRTSTAMPASRQQERMRTLSGEGSRPKSTDMVATFFRSPGSTSSSRSIRPQTVNHTQRPIKKEKDMLPPLTPKAKPAKRTLPPDDAEWIDVDALDPSPPSSSQPRRSGRVPPAREQPFTPGSEPPPPKRARTSTTKDIASTKASMAGPSKKVPAARSGNVGRSQEDSRDSVSDPSSSQKPTPRMRTSTASSQPPPNSLKEIGSGGNFASQSVSDAATALNTHSTATAHRIGVQEASIQADDSQDSVVLLSPPHQNPPPVVSRSSTAVLTYQKHKKFWILDGSVIVRLLDGPTAIQFKLHKSQLMKKSQWFKNVFNQDVEPNAERETIGGCRVYDIPPELGLTLRDFETCLHATDDFIGFSEGLSFADLASLLRASTVLDWTSEKGWALKKFVSAWEPKTYLDTLGTQDDHRRARATEAIVLAKSLLNGVADAVLKPAFYELLRRQNYDLDDFKDEDFLAGSKTKEGKQKEAFQKDRRTLARSGDEDDDSLFRGLATTDQERLIRTRTRLTEKWIEYALGSTSNCKTAMQVTVDSLIPSASSEATSRTPVDQSDSPVSEGRAIFSTTCGVNLRLRWPQLVHESRIFEDYMYDPISGLERLRGASKEWGRDIWCGSCAEIHRSDWKHGKDRLWKLLDDWLALPVVK